MVDPPPAPRSAARAGYAARDTMRASPLWFFTLLVGSAGCLPGGGGSGAGKDGTAPTQLPESAKAPTPVTPPVLGLHARWLTATSGSGVEAVLDGDPDTGWRPDGDPIHESFTLRFEEPLVIERISLRTCADDPPASFTVVVNGTDAGRVDVAPGSPGVLGVGPAGAEVRVSTVQVRVARARPGLCVAEVGFESGEADLLVRAPRAVSGTIRASSVRLPPSAYHPYHLVDQRPLLAWVKGKAGPGMGESFTIRLDHPIVLVAIELWNGDQRAPTVYAAGARADAVALSVDRGAIVQFTLEDRRGPQRLEPPAWMLGDTFTVNVLRVANRARDQDLAVSEVRLWDPFGPLVLRTPDAQDRKDALLAEVGRTPFAPVLDRRWEAVCAGSGPESLRLRSNHVVSLSGPGVSGPERFEGEWARVDADGPWTRVRFIGRRRPVVATWQGPDEEVDHEGDVVDLRIARVSELGREGFAAAWAAAKRPEDRRAFSCVAELDAGDATADFDALVARDALLVDDPGGLDLLWLAPPPG